MKLPWPGLLPRGHGSFPWIATATPCSPRWRCATGTRCQHARHAQALRRPLHAPGVGRANRRGRGPPQSPLPRPDSEGRPRRPEVARRRDQVLLPRGAQEARGRPRLTCASISAPTSGVYSGGMLSMSDKMTLDGFPVPSNSTKYTKSSSHNSGITSSIFKS